MLKDCAPPFCLPVLGTASARAETRGGRWAHEVSEHIQKIPLKKLHYAPGQLALKSLLGGLSTEAQAVLAELHSTLSSRVQGGIRAS